MNQKSAQFHPIPWSYLIKQPNSKVQSIAILGFFPLSYIPPTNKWNLTWKSHAIYMSISQNEILQIQLTRWGCCGDWASGQQDPQPLCQPPDCALIPVLSSWFYHQTLPSSRWCLGGTPAHGVPSRTCRVGCGAGGRKREGEGGQAASSVQVVLKSDLH